MAYPIEANSLKKEPQPQGEKILFADFLRDFFPHLAKTAVPEIVSQMILGIKDCCEVDSQTNAFAFQRGSLIKRKFFGTPEGYWNITPLYTDNLAGLVEKDDAVARSVVEILQVGPSNTDIRYQPHNARPQDVWFNLRKSMIELGFLLDNQTKGENFDLLSKVIDGQNYEIKIQPVLSCYSTNNKPRTFLSVIIYINDCFQFKTSYGQTPDRWQIFDEQRRHNSSPDIELASKADLVFHNGKLYTVIELPRYEDKSQVIAIGESPEYHTFSQIFGAALRAIGIGTFWPGFFGEKNLSLDELKVYYRSSAQTAKEKLAQKFVTNHIFEAPEVMQIMQRAPDLMASFLTYLTYNPFLFLPLASLYGLLDFLPLSSYLKTPEQLEMVLGTMRQELGITEGHEQTSLIYLEKISNKNLKLTDTGPFMFIRALKKSHFIPEDYPETFSGICRLINPFLFIRDDAEKKINALSKMRSIVDIPKFTADSLFIPRPF